MPDDRPEHWQGLQSAQWTQHNPVIAPIPQNTVPSAERPVASLLSIAPEYKRQIQDGYESDPPWRYVTTVLQGNKELEVENQAKLPFFWDDGLLWKNTPGFQPRLCIPKSAVRELFDALHDGNHVGYAKLSEEIQQFCIDRGLKQLREYLRA
ncbi:hypothetical protein E4U59_000742, partial [Claviceps monticola]